MLACIRSFFLCYTLFLSSITHSWLIHSRRQSNSLQPSSGHVSRTESRVSLKDSFSPNTMKDPERYSFLGGRQSPSESAAAAAVVPPRHDHCKVGPPNTHNHIPSLPVLS